MQIIGIDCATQPTKTGLVLASWTGGAPRLEEAAVGSNQDRPEDIASGWIGRASETLLALDAPLGWPRPLAQALSKHRAGEVIPEETDTLFSRTTDRRVKDRLQKRPLEVGANLIARTAHSALKMLEDIRQRTGLNVPLVWDPTSFAGVGVVEVYPAATRIALGIVKDSESRKQLSIHLKGDLSTLGVSPHVLDAAWCTVAGADFLTGRAEPPTHLDLAKREGWIWVR